jgi:hypothetical protein
MVVDPQTLETGAPLRTGKAADHRCRLRTPDAEVTYPAVLSVNN